MTAVGEEVRREAEAPLMMSVSGCRGVVGESLTADVAARYANAIAAWVRGRMGAADRRARVVVARDGRRGGDAIEAVVCGSLAMAGCDVLRLGVASTPAAGLMVTRFAADAGVVITASHNPQAWNGIKAIDSSGAAPPAGEAEAVIGAYRDGVGGAAIWSGVGGLEIVTDAHEHHVEVVLESLGELIDLDRIRRMNAGVVLDAVNASGGMGAMLLLARLGCTVHRVDRCAPGVFPHEPEPIEANLGGLCESVRQGGATLGFAQDPDADRLALVDERGRFIGEEYTLALGARALLELGGAVSGTLAANLSTSRMIEDVAECHGFAVVRSAVGEANVVESMRAHGAVLGGEGNGGVIWPRVVSIRDSLGAMGLVLALLAHRGESLSAVVGSMPAYAIRKRKVELGSIDVSAALGRVAELHSGAGLDRQDGLRADLDLGDRGRAWLHVRASNTEPILRLIAEAGESDEADRLLDEAEAAVLK